MRFGRLSMAAAAAVVGGVLVTFSGCGHDRNHSTSAGAVPTDGYVIALDAYVDGNTSNSVFKSQDKKTYRISYTKSAAQLADRNISVVGQCIDIDVSGDCNLSKGDKSITFPLLTQGATPYVNGATTIAVLTGDKKLLEQAGNVDTTADVTKAAEDPEVAQIITMNRIVSDIVNNDPGKLAVMAEIVKDVNISKESNVSDLVTKLTQAAATKDPNLAKAVEAAGKKTAATIKAIESLKKQPHLNQQDLVKLSSVLMEGDKKQIDETLSDLNVSDENVTKAVQLIVEADENITSSVPPKLALTSVSMGKGLLTVPVLAVPTDENTTVGKFATVTIDSKDHNLSEYYSNITIDVTKDRILKNGSYRANFIIEVKDELVPSNRVTIGLDNVDITLDANKSSVTTVMSPMTSVFVEQEGLPKIEEILGTYAEAKVDHRLVNTDLTFDLNTVLNALSSSDSNNEKIKNAIAALNDYFKKEGQYGVSMRLTNIEPLEGTPKENDLSNQLAFTEIEGVVIVKGENRGSAVVTPPESNNTNPTPPSELKPLTLSNADFALHTYVLKSNDSNEGQVTATFCPNGQAVIHDNNGSFVEHWSIMDGNTLTVENSEVQFFGTSLDKAAYQVKENGQVDGTGIITKVYDDSALTNCAIFTENNTSVELNGATLTTTKDVISANGPFTIQFEPFEVTTSPYDAAIYVGSKDDKNLLLFIGASDGMKDKKFSITYKGQKYTATFNASDIVLK